MGVPRDTFYPYRKLADESEVVALINQQLMRAKFQKPYR